MKTTRNVKKCATKALNKSNIDPPKENASFIHNDNQHITSRQSKIRETVSTQRSQGATNRSKPQQQQQMGVHLRFRNNIISSTKNQRKESNAIVIRDESQLHQHSRQNSSRSHSLGVEKAKKEKEKKSRKKSHKRKKSGGNVLIEQENKKNSNFLDNSDVLETRLRRFNKIEDKENRNIQEQFSQRRQSTIEVQCLKEEILDLQKKLFECQNNLSQQQYKNDCVNQKYKILKEENSKLSEALKQEAENSLKLYDRGQNYKIKYKSNQQELKSLKEEVKGLIDQRNDEINQIRESIEQQIEEYYKERDFITRICQEINIKAYQLHRFYNESQSSVNHYNPQQIARDLLQLSCQMGQSRLVFQGEGNKHTEMVKLVSIVEEKDSKISGENYVVYVNELVKFLLLILNLSNELRFKVDKYLADGSTFSDPGMRYYTNNKQINEQKSEQERHYKLVSHDNDTFHNINEDQQRIPPLLILNDISDKLNQSTLPASGLISGVNSTTNQNNNFKHKFQTHQWQPQILSNIQQMIQDGKTSGRSHETSTFQQHQEYLESLKEAGEDSEEDQFSSQVYRIKDQRHNNHQLKEQINRYDNASGSGCYEADQSYIERSRLNINSSRDSPVKPLMRLQNESQLTSSQNQFDSIPTDINQSQKRYSQNNYNTDTITASSQILSHRTFNLKKEINNLDEEISILQNSLQNALAKRKQN
ncbi:UNKNOWN [Stylonychia lemnae]|uniref:Uncharacterized protein n=1 Tax=Stylonychia lemnae TaxID=5949 RepID=A0A078A4R2_STYLE|nr:UNKNOWN [Stylonychia lemnae]|eukprot:CDW75754.1 UNKNOWN [Stylonychia lemnae]